MRSFSVNSYTSATRATSATSTFASSRSTMIAECSVRRVGLQSAVRLSAELELSLVG
jgi:hypothetical protein